MRLTIHINGMVFKSPISDKITAEKAKDAFFSQLENMNKIEMELEDGSFLIIGEKAVQSAVLIFSEN